jgi:17beta-estradiol 17-dehydrogenase / very-long-chain 3-oxoacyl-CoA reductase
MGAINPIALMVDFVYYPIPILAAIWILMKLWQTYDELECLTERPLAERYGEGSWAVVTGATGGIGLGFVEAFSARGFNLVLIGRNQAKLDKTIRALKKKFNKTKYRTILADFAETPTTEFYDGIMSKMSDLDVSVLVNNVGSLEFQKFTE